MQEQESGVARCWKEQSEADGLTDLSKGSRSCVPHGTTHGF